MKNKEIKRKERQEEAKKIFAEFMKKRVELKPTKDSNKGETISVYICNEKRGYIHVDDLKAIIKKISMVINSKSNIVIDNSGIEIVDSQKRSFYYGQINFENLEDTAMPSYSIKFHCLRYK